MPKRIYESYLPSDRVEITFDSHGDKRWRPAVVVRADPPGVWVMTGDGRHWFVTNTFRIRRPSPDGES